MSEVLPQMLLDQENEGLIKKIDSLVSDIGQTKVR